MADQPRRHGVEHAACQEAAITGDVDQLLLEVSGAARWQRLERWTLDLQFPTSFGIGTAYNFCNEAAVERQLGKIHTATEQQ